MPFPLAHPAAVLPLKRFCPQRLNFAALVIGSLCPDVGYCFGNGDFSHTFFPGSFAFCLPVGLLLLAGFYLVRTPVAAILPAGLRQAFLPPCQRPVGSWFVIVLSLLVGVWTHLFLDSMTHEDGWVVERLPFLRGTLPLIWPGGLAGHEALYMGLTLFGVFWVALSYWSWLEMAVGLPFFTKPWVKRGFSFLFAISVLCVAMSARGERRRIGDSPLAITTLLLLIVFLVGTGQPFVNLPVNKPKNDN